jgi:hypothetical protein
MHISIRSQDDFRVGPMFIVIGAAALFKSHEHGPGAPAQMGPACFPAVLSLILLNVSILIAEQQLPIP